MNVIIRLVRHERTAQREDTVNVSHAMTQRNSDVNRKIGSSTHRLDVSRFFRRVCVCVSPCVCETVGVCDGENLSASH